VSTRRITTLRPLLLALIAIAGATVVVGAALLRPAVSATARTPRIICSPALPCLAVVIDDIGRDRRALERLLALDADLTFSVLPHAPATEASLIAIRAAGRERMLHLPMAPHDRSRISDEPVVLGLDDRPLGEATAACLRAVPDATAFNNHMGSALSRNRAALRTILGAARRARLEVLDSRTVEGSQLCAAARELGMRCLERDLFLDDPPHPDVILSAWLEGLKRARARGWAVVIGHPHTVTVELLGELLRKRGGVRIVRYSQLLSAVDAT
jgi:polysaccharide deacetylase 2 family uncharacterized protein YibQ